MRSSGECLSLIKKNFNTKEYIQFIKPLIEALEDENKRIQKQTNKDFLRRVTDSVVHSIMVDPSLEEIEETKYISVERVEELFRTEINNYL